MTLEFQTKLQNQKLVSDLKQAEALKLEYFMFDLAHQRRDAYWGVSAQFEAAEGLVTSAKNLVRKLNTEVNAAKS